MVLEHQGGAPAGHLDVAGGRPVEAGDQVEQGRLAAARGTEQGDELAGGDVERDVVQDGVALPGRPNDLCTWVSRTAGRVIVDSAAVVTFSEVVSAGVIPDTSCVSGLAAGWWLGAGVRPRPAR
ncbi:hypothetical protein GCM10025734_25460 [Kitasatospora paranensis]